MMPDEKVVPPAASGNPFHGFFFDPLYLKYKNHLFNYRLRRRACLRELMTLQNPRILEIGSGISPMADAFPGVFFTDVSDKAMRWLRRTGVAEKAAVTDINRLPFPGGSFDAIICSEVLEHIRDDAGALKEMRRVLTSGGALILTVPVNPKFYAYDDKFVHHERRYDCESLKGMLESSGFTDIRVRKVAGLIEKISTLSAVIIFDKFFGRENPQKAGSARSSFGMRFLFPVYKLLNLILEVLVYCESKVLPVSLSSIVLLHSKKK